MQRHIYARAWHGTVTEFPGWAAFIWRHFNRGQGLLIPTLPDPSMEQLRRFMRGMQHLNIPWIIESDAVADAGLERRLLENGAWEVGYELPGHFIPTDADWLARLAPLPSGFSLISVDGEDTVADFAYVQDKAYQESYDWPRGCAALFYTDAASLIGPDTLGAVIYDPEGRPVRTAQIVAKRGIVGGVAGAAVPRVRGQHLGEPLIAYLAAKARDVYGTPVVHHVTMPVARPIAQRLGLERVSLYRRWVRKKTGDW